MVDIASLLTLQARSRRNAQRAARLLRREREKADDARKAASVLAAAWVASDARETEPQP